MDLVESGITVKITLDKGSQELIFELKEYYFMLENSEQQNSAIVHLHKRSNYKNQRLINNNLYLFRLF